MENPSFFNPNKFQSSSQRSRNLFLLNDNKNVGPGLYNLIQTNLKSQKGIYLNPETKPLSYYLKEFLKSNTPAPGNYNIERAKNLEHFKGKVQYNKTIYNKIKGKETIGPSSYDPRVIIMSKSFSFPRASYDNSKILKKNNNFGKINYVENKENYRKNQIKGYSFGSEDRKYYNILKFEEVGPGKYELNTIKTHRIFHKFTESNRNTSLPIIGPGPARYNLQKDLFSFDPYLKNYKKMHDLAFQPDLFKKIQIKKRNSVHCNNPSLYELIKSTNAATILKRKAMIKIRDSLDKNERKNDHSNLLKKNLGFTTSVRKNEYNILQRMILSPGPIYDTREEFAQHAVKVKIPIDKRKSLWETTENPGPGTYYLNKEVSKFEGEAFNELQKFVKRERILKKILKN